MADQDQDKGKTPASGETEPAATRGSRRRRRRGKRARNKPAAPDPSKLKFFTLIPANTRIDFVGSRKKGLLFSLFLMLVAFGVMSFNVMTTGSALNYGIDFQGGSSVRLALTQEADVEEMRELLDAEDYSGSSAVAVPGHPNEVLIRVKEVVTITEDELAACREALSAGLAEEGIELLEDGFAHPPDSSKIFLKFTDQPSNADIERWMTKAGCDGTASAGVGKDEEYPVEYALIGVGNEIAKRVDQRLGEGTVDHIVTSETVGAKVGSQLKSDGVQAMLFAIGFIFLFVMIRFDLRFAPGGIVALAHDAIIVVGAFAISGKEFNLQSIAAILTIIGYSINDTIVVFDRVRERVALHRDDPIEETTNTALNETLSRTILTSTTTIIVVLATWILGSGPIKDFAFALFIGLIAGTYSSLWVASPVFLWVNEKMYKGKGHLLMVDEDGKEGTGTLLGPEAARPEAGESGSGNEAEAADTGADAGAGAFGMTSGAAMEGAEAGEVQVTDVDKPVGERKTRRRRRRPKS